MVDIPAILQFGWPGQSWSLRNSSDAFNETTFAAALTWDGANSLPKPTLSEVEAQRTPAESAAEAERIAKVQVNALTTKDDKLLQALEVLALAVDDLQAKARNTSAFGYTSQVDTLVTRLAQIRAMS